jgi:tetratricopeptide (TPR) repeat protein
MTYDVRCWLLLALLSLSACASRAAPVQTAHAPSAGELLARGLEYARTGEDLAAEQYFTAARAAGEPEQRVVRELITVCVRSNRLEHALMHGRLYMERYPDDHIIRHAMASIHFAKGDALSARHELELLLGEWPDHAESHFLLALILREQYADMEGARHSLEQYLALAPTGAHAGEARAWIKRSATFPVSTSNRRVP